MSAPGYEGGAWTQPGTRRAFYYRLWRAADSRTLLVLIHGFGEHAGRYQRFASALAEQGITVAAPDLWGHGHSGGSRGDLGSVVRCAADLHALTHAVFLPRCGHDDYAIFGHSFGGLVAIQWGLDDPDVRRMVVQSPLLAVGFPIPQWKELAAWVLGWCCPHGALAMNLDVNALSRNPAIVEAYRTDPLVHNRMSAGTYRAMRRAQDDAMTRAPTLRPPTLLLCGGADRIVSVEAARRWLSRVNCETHQVTFPACYHELHHEPVAAEVVQSVCHWVLENRKPVASS